MWKCQKRPIIRQMRPRIRQKRPTNTSIPALPTSSAAAALACVCAPREVCVSVKRGLLIRQKRPTDTSIPEQPQALPRSLPGGKSRVWNVVVGRALESASSPSSSPSVSVSAALSAPQTPVSPPQQNAPIRRPSASAAAGTDSQKCSL